LTASRIFARASVSLIIRLTVAALSERRICFCGSSDRRRPPLPNGRLRYDREHATTVGVGNRQFFAIFSQLCQSGSDFLVRWLSGRKQRFAKAPYLSKGTEGSNPSLTEPQAR